MIDKLLKKKSKLRKASGVALIEYVLIITLISLFLVGGFRTVGNKYTTMYEKIHFNLSNATGSGE
ncbi:MAG: hypothetical protein LBJ71_00725 [Holosporaceae bacterium]|jgi:Flp pilus assembly pilin Flp|nr:hypothetical protein [Holosporaceae bacterium]